MNRTAELGIHIAEQVAIGAKSLDDALVDPLKGVANARKAIKSARAVLRLLEASDPELLRLAGALRSCASRIGPIRDAQVQRRIPPPLSPSTRVFLQQTRDELWCILEEFDSAIDGLKVPNSEIVLAAGAAYRQARRRFLRALPADESSGIDFDALNQCRKSTQRVYLQLDALFDGEHTKRSTKFGQLGTMMESHRDMSPFGSTADASLARLEAEITKLGVDLFGSKPSSYRDWLTEKLRR